MKRHLLLGSVLAATLLLFVSGCSETTTPANAPTTTATEAPKAEAEATPVVSKPKRQEPPLPAFEGSTLSGERRSVSDLLGKRLVLLFFNPSVPAAKVMAEAVAGIADERGPNNFQIYGVAMTNDPAAGKKFLEESGLDAPAFHDPDGAFIRRIAGRAMTTALVVVDADGYIIRAVPAFPSEGRNPSAAAETALRDWLRLENKSETSTDFGERPAAPLFSAERLEGETSFELASLRGKPTVVIFFLHTCPHCHHALTSLRDSIAKMPEGKKPNVVGISIDYKPSAVELTLKDMGLDFFTVLFDRDESIRDAYSATTGVPTTFLLDDQLRIVARVDGWRDDRDPPLMRMRLAQIAKTDVPMLLHSKGYSGDEFCGVCHGTQHSTWEFTNHAGAFDTLVKHGENTNPECVGCHVVGWEQAGGWSLDAPDPALEGVGCETCHGRGGPHLSPEFVKNHDYSGVCVTCHNPQHSLGFDYATFLPKVSHAANLQFASLTGEAREKFLAERRKPRENLLPSRADYVGSNACQSCHAKEFETWSGQPHAKAHATLATKGETENKDCLKCHTTGFSKPGGFALGDVADANLAAVGCESCHGPGGDHIGENATRIGTILSLGDKCDSCVILQICGSCHDDANDPGFEFEVQDKIDRQRHGTIEPSAGTSGAHAHGLPTTLPSSTEVGLLERALAGSSPDPS